MIKRAGLPGCATQPDAHVRYVLVPLWLLAAAWIMIEDVAPALSTAAEVSVWCGLYALALYVRNVRRESKGYTDSSPRSRVGMLGSSGPQVAAHPSLATL